MAIRKLYRAIRTLYHLLGISDRLQQHYRNEGTYVGVPRWIWFFQYLYLGLGRGRRFVPLLLESWKQSKAQAEFRKEVM